MRLGGLSDVVLTDPVLAEAMSDAKAGLRNRLYLVGPGALRPHVVKGLVDAGRISQDTGHTFGASRDAASGVAARYYMNRNFFIADPDAFTVSPGLC